MVKGYEKGKPAKTRLSRLKTGLLKAGKAVKQGAIKAQKYRKKFYEEWLPAWEKAVEEFQIVGPGDAILGYPPAERPRRRKKRRKKKRKIIIIEE